MKICYVLHQYLPRYFTGTEQYVHRISTRVAGRGHDIRVFTLDPQFGDETHPFAEEELEVSGIPVTRVHFWLPLHRHRLRMEYRHPYMAERFGDFLDRTTPDVVHFFHLRFLGADLIEQTTRRGIPALVHLMDYWFLCPAVILTRRDGALCEGPPDGGLGCLQCVAPELHAELAELGLRDDLMRWGAAEPPATYGGPSHADRAAVLLARPAYLRRALLGADRIFAPSKFLADVFVANGYPADRFTVMPYGIDVGALQRARAAAPQTPPVFGFVGSIAPHKGVHHLVEAFLRVRGDVRLRIHGRPSDFPDFAASTQQRAQADPRIEFVGPFEAAELADVLARLDLLVVPSLWYENTPFVVLEAFGGGVPVVATDLGGLAEIVRDGRNGERFRHGDVDDLTRRLQRLVDEPERLARYRAGITPVRTLDANVEDLLGHYHGATR